MAYLTLTNLALKSMAKIHTHTTKAKTPIPRSPLFHQ